MEIHDRTSYGNYGSPGPRIRHYQSLSQLACTAAVTSTQSSWGTLPSAFLRSALFSMRDRRNASDD